MGLSQVRLGVLTVRSGFWRVVRGLQRQGQGSLCGDAQGPGALAHLLIADPSINLARGHPSMTGPVEKLKKDRIVNCLFVRERRILVQGLSLRADGGR